MAQERAADEKRARVRRTKDDRGPARHPAADTVGPLPGLTGLQRRIGNRALQRLLAQRDGNAPYELNEETAARIDRERGGGQALDGALAGRAGEAMGHDMSEVRIHTSPEADGLSRQLGAKAFATGRDVFFRAGAYDPHSSGGQELITHELTHVVQQGVGAVAGGGRMTVNAPGDAYEQEADAVSRAVTGQAAAPSVQRQGRTNEEEEVQLQPEDEEEPVQAQAGEEEEEIQMQEEDEKEEEALQMQTDEGEEEEALP